MARRRNNNLKFKCVKCENTQCDVGQFSAVGGVFTKVLNLQNKRFTTVTCERCSYTEIYRTDSSTLENVFDFFTN